MYTAYTRKHKEKDGNLSKEDLTSLRALFERAVGKVGMHATEGCQAWDAYRDFEQDEFVRCATRDQARGNGQMDATEAQYEVILKLFQRQLSIPHVGADKTMKAYKAFKKTVMMKGKGADQAVIQ